MPPHRHAAVAAIIGRPESTVRNWSNRDLAPAFSGHVKGRWRPFSERDILAARLMGDISDLGVPLWDALQMVKAALAKLDEYCTETGSDDLAEDIKAVGLNKAVLYFWREGSDWKSRLEHDYGWTEAFAKVGIGQSDLPRSYAAAHVHAIAAEVAERIRAFEAAKRGAK